MAAKTRAQRRHERADDVVLFVFLLPALVATGELPFWEALLIVVVVSSAASVVAHVCVRATTDKATADDLVDERRRGRELWAILPMFVVASTVVETPSGDRSVGHSALKAVVLAVALGIIFGGWWEWQERRARADTRGHGIRRRPS